MSHNRRKFIRINGRDAHCNVQIGVGECTGIVIDESIEGLRIGDLDLLILMADQQVTVEHQGETIAGRCRFVSRGENGLFQVGIYRESRSCFGAPNSVLLNSFFHFSGCDIVCLPVGVIDKDRIRIRLLDGNEFNVKRELVFQYTRQERAKTLQSEKKLSELVQVYTAMDPYTQWYGRDDLLCHEFGPVSPALSTAL